MSGVPPHISTKIGTPSEISLHVDWQTQFLEDLKNVIRLSPFDALIATHSPQIINTRWDLTVELEAK